MIGRKERLISCLVSFIIRFSKTIYRPLVSVALVCSTSFYAPALPVINSKADTVSVDSTVPGRLTLTTGESEIINYDSFSIGADEAVEFIQPSSSSVCLNRVTGSSGSDISGLLSANGQIFLVNPNGVLIHEGATVSAASFLASSLNISDSDFRSGNYFFSGGTGAGVVNSGLILVERGGYVGLVGPEVVNSGKIDASRGRVALIAGDDVSVSFGEELISYSVGAEIAGALVSNSGLIAAGGGEVLLTTGAASSIASGVVNNSGTIEASCLESGEGVIRLVAVTIENSGTLTVEKHGEAAVDGGRIELAGQTVNNSGSVLVGAGAHVTDAASESGTQEEEGAEEETVAAEAAAAATSGDLAAEVQENSVLINATDIFNDGIISAQDGLIDIDAQGDVSNTGALMATGGKIIIEAQGDVSSTGTVEADEMVESGASFELGGDVNVKKLSADNDDGAITLTGGTLTGTHIADTENIEIAPGAHVTLIGNTLFEADSDMSGTGAVLMHAGSAIHGDGFVLEILASGFSELGTIDGVSELGLGASFEEAHYTQTGDISVSEFCLEENTTFVSDASVYSFSSPDDFDLDSEGAAFMRFAGGNGIYQSTAWQIADIYGLQGLDGGAASGFYVLIADIDATVAVSWNDGAGFNPIDSIAAGNFNGQGHVVYGLEINRPLETEVGLFGSLQGATVSNLSLEGVLIRGGDRTGAVAGECVSSAYANIISGVNVNGDVYGAMDVGGLVGELGYGRIEKSFSECTVTGTTNVGGLVGSVLAGGYVRDSFSDGFADGVSNVGGAAGRMYGNGSLMERVYSYSSVRGSGGSVGGLVGYSSHGSIEESFSAGAVSGLANTGGFVGLDSHGTYSGCYWVTDVSLLSNAAGSGALSGVSGLTLAQMSDDANFSGWDFTNDWTMVRDMPFSRAFYSTDIYNVYQLQLMNLDLSADYRLMRDIDARSTIYWNPLYATFELDGGEIVNRIIKYRGGFDPVGDNITPFAGTFDGQGYCINYLYIHTEVDDVPVPDEIGAESVFGPETTWGTNYYTGLFGYTCDATIENVALTNVGVYGGLYTGALVGRAEDTDISGIYVTGAVRGSDYTGGVIGEMLNGSLSDVVLSSISVRGDQMFYVSDTVWGDRVGGIAGSFRNGTFSGDISISSLILSGGTYLGSVFGEARSIANTVSDVTVSDADISGWAKIGGFLGYVLNCVFENMSCVNGVIFSDDSTAGGFAGQMESCSVTSSSIEASVHSDGANAGGFVGDVRNSTIIDSSFIGHVAGSSSVGGFIGMGYNVDIESSEVGFNTSVLGSSLVGGFAGRIMGGSFIYDCLVLSPMVMSSSHTLGGFVGQNDGASTIRSCGVTGGFVQGLETGIFNIGGFVGRNEDGSIIDDSYTYADIYLLDVDAMSRAGFVGFNAGCIYESFVSNTVFLNGVHLSGTTDVGGFLGEMYDWTNASSRFNENFWNMENGLHAWCTDGGTFAWIEGDEVFFAEKNFTQMTDESTFSAYDFDTTWIMLGSGPRLRREWSEEIYSVEGLQMIAMDTHADYKLIADVNAAATSYWHGGEGFEPIDYFYGTLDGDGYSVYGLTINRPDDKYVGLFSNMCSAVVKDIDFWDVSITGGDYTGALAGFGQNTDNVFSNVGVSGSIEGSRGTGALIGYQIMGTLTIDGSSFEGDIVCQRDVGGLVGMRIGSIEISDSFSTGTVTGTDRVGGLVGWVCSSDVSSITDSYSSSSVSGSRHVGGLAGELMNVVVERCFADGDVSGSLNAGGLVGLLVKSFVSNCFAIGDVSGNSAAGGLIGANARSEVEFAYSVGHVSGAGGGFVGKDMDGVYSHCVWNMETSGKTDACGNDIDLSDNVKGYMTQDFIDSPGIVFDGWTLGQETSSDAQISMLWIVNQASVEERAEIFAAFFPGAEYVDEVLVDGYSHNLDFFDMLGLYFIDYSLFTGAAIPVAGRDPLKTQSEQFAALVAYVFEYCMFDEGGLSDVPGIEGIPMGVGETGAWGPEAEAYFKAFFEWAQSNDISSVCLFDVNKEDFDTERGFTINSYAVTEIIRALENSGYDPFISIFSNRNELSTNVATAEGINVISSIYDSVYQASGGSDAVMMFMPWYQNPDNPSVAQYPLEFPDELAEAAAAQGKDLVIKIEPWNYDLDDSSAFEALANLNAPENAQYKEAWENFVADAQAWMEKTGQQVKVSVGHEFNLDDGSTAAAWYPWQGTYTRDSENNIHFNELNGTAIPELYKQMYINLHDSAQSVSTPASYSSEGLVTDNDYLYPVMSWAKGKGSVAVPEPEAAAAGASVSLLSVSSVSLLSVPDSSSGSEGGTDGTGSGDGAGDTSDGGSGQSASPANQEQSSLLSLSSSSVPLPFDAGVLGTENLIMVNQPSSDVPLAYQAPEDSDDDEEEVA